MASMVLASSPLSAQSFVKLRTNSNYSHPSCYVPRVKNSYLHFSYKNVSHIESSKSLFVKGDGNFSISSQKIPRVASTYSPSLNVIKATSSREQNIYHFTAFELGNKTGIELGDRYKGMTLLIVNIPLGGSKWTEWEIDFLNGLRKQYKDKITAHGGGFEVLGFFYDMENLHNKRSRFLPSNLFGGGKKDPAIEAEKAKIRKLAHFPIFDEVDYHVNDNDLENLWYFLRNKTDGAKITEEFDKFLVDGNGIPQKHFPRFDGEIIKPEQGIQGGKPDDKFTTIKDNPVKAAIDSYRWEKRY